jgi:excisionase family DNA binding protein
MNNSLLMKSATPRRPSPLALQFAKSRAQRDAILVDPVLRLREAAEMLGNPSYPTLKRWIDSGALRVLRVGRGQYRTRLSFVTQFLKEHELVPHV